MRHRPTAPFARAAVALGLLGLAACGVDGGAGAPLEVASSGRVDAAVVARAASATQEASTYQVSLEMEIEADGSAITVTVDGAFDQAAGRGRMTTTFGGPDELGPVSDLSTELILDGADAYLRSEVFEQLGAGDGPWFRLPVEGIADAEMGSARPDASFGILEELGGEVDEIGREEVRGVDTRHLRTEVRLGDLLERADPDRRAQLEQQFEGQGVDLGSLGGPTQIDVWIDDDGLLRRMEMAFAITTDGSEATMRQTIEIFGYGEPVEIEVPPADQVSDLDLGVLGGD